MDPDFWDCFISELLQTDLYIYDNVIKVNSLTSKKADNKKFLFKFSKNVKCKLYNIENLKTRGQTV